MRKTLFFFIILLTLPLATFAQQNHAVCGMDQAMIDLVNERLQRNKEAYLDNPVQFRDVVYIPIKFHLVARNDGSGRVNIGKVLDQLCALNEDFAPLDIQFYMLDGFNNINNTIVYEEHAGTAGTIMNFNKVNNAINIFVPNDATPSGPSPEGNVLGYYTPFYDWLVIKRGEISNNNTTVSHEMGHFFSLPHPFNGWDIIPYDPSIHGTPAPTIASDGTTPTEFANGTNCENAGDFICDTPACFGEGLGWPNCNYTGGHMDPNGEEIDPDEYNFMDYFLSGSCDLDSYYFSDMQREMILADFNSPSRNYIRNNHVPNLTTPNSVDKVYPLADEITPGYNAVNFQWTAVDGADAYFLEIDRTPAFTVDPIELIVYGNSKVITALDSDRKYYWRVRPYNAYRTCTGSTGSSSFTTGTATSTNDLDFVKDWTVNPNPASANSLLNITIQSDVNFSAELKLYNMTGQQIRSFGERQFNAGENIERISTQGLTPGVYTLAVQTTEGNMIKKVIINN